MKKILLIQIIVILLAVLTILAANNQSFIAISFEKPYYSNYQKNTNIGEWEDGAFCGTWSLSETTNSETFKGKLTLGRSHETRSYTARLYNMNSTYPFFIRGFFFKSFIIGLIEYSEKTKILIPFYGKLSLISDKIFQGQIQIRNYEIIIINGSYEYSFLPVPTGSYEIGIQDRHLIDQSRFEPFTENPDDFREMMIRIWYPIEFLQLNESIEHMDYWTFQWLKNRSPIPLITISDNAYLSINPHSYRNGILAESEDCYPLLIFSPGYDGNFEIYTSFIENIVSHGYIVISINHPFVSGLTVFPDGRRISSSIITNDSFPYIVDDVLFVLNYAEQINQFDQMFQHRIDMSKVGMYGHSFGGSATLQCMKQDPRIKAGLTLDGAFSSNIIPETFNKPFFMMIAENSFAKNSSEQLFNKIYEDVFLLTINGSTHYAFTDVGLLMNHFIPLIPPHLLLFGTMNAKRMVNITRSFIRAFFDIYLNNESTQQLNDLEQIFDEVILSDKIILN